MTDDPEDKFEHLTQTLAIGDQLEAELKRLAQEGWELTPGTTPVAVYQLRRHKPFGGRGGVSIDESKITIIKGNGT